MNGDKLIKWINAEIERITHLENAAMHGEQMILFGCRNQLKILEELISSGMFD